MYLRQDLRTVQKLGEVLEISELDNQYQADGDTYAFTVRDK